MSPVRNAEGRSNEELVRRESRAGKSNEELVRRESRAGRSNEELTMRLRRSNKLLVRELERHDARS